MKRTQEFIENIANVNVINEINPLQPPEIKKSDIPKFILCKNFEKANQKVETKMKRYNQKVTDLTENMQQIENDIAAMKKEQKKWHKKANAYVDRSDPKSVEKQNHAARNSNRLIDKIENYIDKYNDLVDMRKDAKNDAQEKLEELTAESLEMIDDDIVAVMDKLVSIATKLYETNKNPEDIISSIEICFIGLKIFNSFEEHIDNNIARKETKDRFAEINLLLSNLLEKDDARNYMANIFRRNAILIEKNADLYIQLIEVIEGVDQKKMNSMANSLEQAFGEEFNTKFNYNGIIDPSELDSVALEIHKTIDGINANINLTKELDDSTQAIAEAGITAYHKAESLLSDMKKNVEDMGDNLISNGSFEFDMIEETVIEEFYTKDVRPSVIAFREDIVTLIGKDQIDSILIHNEDRYSIEKAENALKQADLSRLQVQRDHIDKHIEKLSNMINNNEKELQKVGEVTENNAKAFRSSTSLLYIMSLFPLIGFMFALIIYSKIKKFATGFSSTNESYQNLSAEIFTKIKTIMTINIVLSLILGIGGGVAFFYFEIGSIVASSNPGISGTIELLPFKITPELAINVIVPGIVFLFYIVTYAIFSKSFKRLQSYIDESKA